MSEEHVTTTPPAPKPSGLPRADLAGVAGLIGIIILLAIIAGLFAEPCETTLCMVVDRWQPLIASLVALAAALITVREMQRAREADQSERNRQERMKSNRITTITIYGLIDVSRTVERILFSQRNATDLRIETLTQCAHVCRNALGVRFDSDVVSAFRTANREIDVLAKELSILHDEAIRLIEVFQQWQLTMASRNQALEQDRLSIDAALQEFQQQHQATIEAAYSLRKAALDELMFMIGETPPVTHSEPSQPEPGAERP